MAYSPSRLCLLILASGEYAFIEFNKQDMYYFAPLTLKSELKKGYGNGNGKVSFANARP